MDNKSWVSENLLVKKSIDCSMPIKGFFFNEFEIELIDIKTLTKIKVYSLENIERLRDILSEFIEEVKRK